MYWTGRGGESIRCDHVQVWAMPVGGQHVKEPPDQCSLGQWTIFLLLLCLTKVIKRNQEYSGIK